VLLLAKLDELHDILPSGAGGRIKCITICENSHSIASGSDNGSVHVIKVESITKKEGQVNRYTGVSTVEYLDKAQGAVVAIDHFNTDSQSVLVYATGNIFYFFVVS